MSSDLENTLVKATQLESKYEWFEASLLYRQTLNIVNEEDYYKKGEIQEKIGHSLHRAAFQAVIRDEFLAKIQNSKFAYIKSEENYEKSENIHNEFRILRCKAVGKYLDFWYTSDPDERRRYLRESFDFLEKTLDYLIDAGENLEYCKTLNDLSNVPLYISKIEWDRQFAQDSLGKAIFWVEKAIEILEDDCCELSRSFVSFVIFQQAYVRYFIDDLKEINELEKKINEYRNNAIKIAEKVGDAYQIGVAYSTVYSLTLEDNKKWIKFAEESKDIYLKAYILHSIAYQTYWNAYVLEDPDERNKLSEEAMYYYDQAQKLFDIVNFQTLFHGKISAQYPGGYIEYYWDKSRWETDPLKKQEFLMKSESAGIEAIEIAEKSDEPNNLGRVYHVYSAALAARARIESNDQVKETYLLKALDYRRKNIEIMNKIIPYYYWNHGVYQNLLALIQQELAIIQIDENKKITLLNDAKKSAKKSIDLIKKSLPRIFFDSYNWEPFSRYLNDYATILKDIYVVTKAKENLREAIKIWYEAIDIASKMNLVTRIAELYWEIAKTQSTIGEHTNAAENFLNSSNNYHVAAQNIKNLHEFYQDYTSYMLAWSEFERARQKHIEKRYLQAKKHYEEAANLFMSTSRWNYLSPNHLAWATLSNAEDFSRRELSEEARDIFKKASKLFEEAQKSLKIKLNTIDAGEEKHTIQELIEASERRYEYCLSRIELEEARILDRKGEHLESSKRYGQAANRFKQILESFHIDENRNEIQPILFLCQAWQKMMLAEEQMSSILYSEAANLFMKVREYALDQTTRLLAQAHSSFCKALEYGIQFELTRETSLFSEAKRHIEAATNHYLRAGYDSFSNYATASNRLLDGYMYTYNAQKEIDPDKKTRFYQLAERLLQDSAGLFLKAKHPEKSNEVRTILENIKGEKEIAQSLVELMHGPSIVSTTSSFSTPIPTHEQAVGLERFESADIQANFIADRRQLSVGEDLMLEIELVNAGKAPAQLIKVEDIMINGFEWISYPDICRVEDSYLDMKGRTLSPLKTQELKLVLKPLIKGTFEMKPRILYLDESGKYKSHEPDPVSITVQELGIRGWIRGPRR